MSVRSPLGATRGAPARPEPGAAADRGCARRCAARAGPSPRRADALRRADRRRRGHTSPLLPESIRPPSRSAGRSLQALGPSLTPAARDRPGRDVRLLLVVVPASRQLSARAVLGTIAALYAIMLLAPPLISTDMFSYQSYSRMGGLYGFNPYLARAARDRAGPPVSASSAPSGPTPRARTGRCSPCSATCWRR